MLNRIATITSLAVLLLLAPLVQSAQADRAKKTKCANNLRQLALGVIQYADDKRFFPHVGSLRELDGDVTTNHTPIAMRIVMNFFYLDDPEVFVCPESYDGAAEWKPENDGRAWFWGGNTYKDLTVPPLQRARDPALNATVELSYGWTRKPMNNNVSSVAVLLADRAVNAKGAETTPLAGNHSDGWNVVHADGSAQFLRTDAEPFPGGFLSAVEKEETGAACYLAIKPQTDAKTLAEPYTKPRKRPGKVDYPKPAK